MVELSPSKRNIRLVVTGVALILLLLGTVIGDDDDFPFGPFRMYATSNSTTGVIATVSVEIQTGDDPWQEFSASPATIGMNAAEIEGQLPRFAADPQLLGAIARSYANLHPGDEPVTGVRIISHGTVVKDRVPTGETTEEVLAEWQAP